MGLSDIASSQGTQHAGTTDITPAHCLALALTRGGGSDPSMTLTPPYSQDSQDGIPGVCGMFMKVLLGEYER